jgi:hypothetical protein
MGLMTCRLVLRICTGVRNRIPGELFLQLKLPMDARRAAFTPSLIPPVDEATPNPNLDAFNYNQCCGMNACLRTCHWLLCLPASVSGPSACPPWRSQSSRAGAGEERE